MAGEGRRFKQAGFLLDKPFILINGRPMIELVVNNLNLKDEPHIFIVRKEQYEKYGLSDYLPSLVKKCHIVQVDKLTEGAACTVALAEKYVEDDRVVVANSDQYINYKLSNFFEFSNLCDGAILTFNANHPKWSYVKTVDYTQLKQYKNNTSDYIIDKKDYSKYCKIIEVAEKKVISNKATVGIYTWRRPEFLFDSIRKMIKENFRVNGEFYLCPTYQYILDKEIWDYHISSEYVKGLGTPEDLDRFVKGNNNGY